MRAFISCGVAFGFSPLLPSPKIAFSMSIRPS